MKAKTVLALILVIVVVVGTPILLMNKPPEPDYNNTTNLIKVNDYVLTQMDIHVNQENIADGLLVFAIRGEGNESVKLTLQSLAVHSPFYDRWVILNYEDKDFIIGNEERFVSSYLTDGIAYNDMYFYLPSVKIYEGENEYSAWMINRRFNIPGYFVQIEADKVTYAVMDILKNESFYKIQDGRRVFIPKIHLMVYRDANLTMNAGVITMHAGEVYTDAILGMDETGEVGIGLTVKQGQAVTLGNETVVLT